MLSESLIRSLKGIAGSDNVLTSKEDRFCYAYDATNQIFLPDAVVFPSNTEDVSRILKLANTERFYVTPRGAGTGLSGGSIPVSGGVVLSLERMRRVLRIDTENMIAVVEPGVVNFELQMELGKAGLFFPPEPTSMRYCTIGGNIAECAGGPRSVKYGVTRDYVLGLGVVLPTGEVMNAGGNPSAVEFMDMTSVKCTRESERFDFNTDNGAVLLIELDGERESLDRRSGAVSDICLRKGASDVRGVPAKKEVKDLWWLRGPILPSLVKIRPHKMVNDVVIPMSVVSEFLQKVREIERGKVIIIACFGHAGEGNIHVNILFDKNNAEEAGKAKEAVDDIINLTIRLGGTISGEHGIGMTKRVYAGMEIHPVAVEVMKKVKGGLDPNGILNPGKVLTEAMSG